MFTAPSWGSGRSSRLGKTPEAETPYREAQQLWDNRMGASLTHARTWRTAAFASLALAAAMSAGVVALALRPAAVPFVIEASETGEARLVGPAQSAYEPSDAQLSWHLARFVEMIRGLPSDPIVVRQNWLRAYDWATQAGAQVLNTTAEEETPFAKVGKSTVAVEVLSVVRASPDSFQLRWRESTYANGALIDVERFTGVATIVIDPASTPERLSKNPLGLYVHAFNWSRDLHQ
ncbi:MAG: conjugal transfer protein TrbF [Sphingomonadales bacterium]|nr:MAG: conjugal transfer protein TrbF [Sphingomonadales bacterium]